MAAERFLAMLLILALCLSGSALAAPTVVNLPVSNGFGVGAYSLTDHCLDLLSDHLYASWDSATPTVNWCYDVFWGLRANGQNLWMKGVVESKVGYLEGTGILQTVQSFGALQVEAYWFAPFWAESPVLISVARVTNTGTAALPDSAAFLLQNLHLGGGTAGTQGESIHYDSSRQSYVETGRTGAPAAIYRALPAPSHHGASPQNPYQLVLQGGKLVDVDSSGPLDDLVAGFEFDVPVDGVLQPGQSFFSAVVVALADPAQVDAVQGALDNALGGKGPLDLLTGEIGFWDDWHGHDQLPGNLSDPEKALARMALVWLKMAQVREPARSGGKPTGQILASLPPGQWNISWVRDAAYSIRALAQSGHPDEARSGVQFILNADAGHYQAEVGTPYGVSVCRYFGCGLEDSDENADGPNIEFDDFGSFLLALEAAAGSDASFLQGGWSMASQLSSDVLVSLTEADSGLLRPDSSIWERHWNGEQKHFTYSSAMGAAGLCAASRLAAVLGDGERQRRYAEAALVLRAGIRAKLLDPSSILAGNLEELVQGSNYFDAAVADAFLQGVIPPADPAAAATFDGLTNRLLLSNGGYFRNDDGDWYDSQEWVFADLRMSALAFALGRIAAGQALLDRITRLATENLGLFPELFEAGTDKAAGAIPMAGFGAGVYLLALWARQEPQPLSFCAAPVVDGGDGADGSADGGDWTDGAADDGGPAADSDGGGPDTGKPSPPGCGCGQGGIAPVALAWLVLAGFLGKVRRTRPCGRS